MKKLLEESLGVLLRNHLKFEKVTANKFQEHKSNSSTSFLPTPRNLHIIFSILRVRFCITSSKCIYATGVTLLTKFFNPPCLSRKKICMRQTLTFPTFLSPTCIWASREKEALHFLWLTSFLKYLLILI